MPRHLLVDDDLSPHEQEAVLDEAARMKKDRFTAAPLTGPRSVAVLVTAASTRGLVILETAVAELGGHPVIVHAPNAADRNESPTDLAAAISRHVSAVVVATPDHHAVERLARAATVPVVNARTDYANPCHALADLLTIRERKGALRGVKLAFVGDGNSVAQSLMLAGAVAGMHIHVASPRGFEPIYQALRRASAVAETTGATVRVGTDPAEAVRGADVVYTDMWESRTLPVEPATRSLVFQPYRVDRRLFALAASDALFLHAMPVRRGEEVDADVVDGPRSAVLDQADNRLHAVKAALSFLLGAS